MAVGFKIITLVPSAAVANNGTMTFTYASGDASQWKQSGEVLVIEGLQTTLAQAANTFTLAYGGSSVVVTYKGATSIPAGTRVSLQLPLAAFAKITDGSTGAVSNAIAAITDVPTKNAIASIVAKLNLLIDLSQDGDNIPS